MTDGNDPKKAQARRNFKQLSELRFNFLPHDGGGMMSYAPSYTDLWRRVAVRGDKILKGAKPGDLPVEQPIKCEFFINLKAANQIG